MFEVVVAIFIMALIIIGVVILSTNSISNSSYSRNKTLAGRYAQEAIEWLRSQRDENISSFINNVTSNSSYCLDFLSWGNTGFCGDLEVIPNTVFKREVDLSTESSSPTMNIITATVVVSWSDTKGEHEARSVTDFTDIREK